MDDHGMVDIHGLLLLDRVILDYDDYYNNNCLIIAGESAGFEMLLLPLNRGVSCDKIRHIF